MMASFKKSKIDIEINNLSEFSIKRSAIKMVCQETIAALLKRETDKGKYSISIALVGEEEIMNLNFKYRKKNKVTDVLSFCEFENGPEMVDDDKEVHLGELVLCPSYIKEETARGKTDWQKDFLVALSHGVLHLLGVKHGRKMFDIQDEVAEKVFQSFR